MALSIRLSALFFHRRDFQIATPAHPQFIDRSLLRRQDNIDNIADCLSTGIIIKTEGIIH
ncbi:hypothetical protein MMIC_P0733 [Mariprofundus micogutta]|uniref:Uncharacterized protein n=1 Tax=Mariprofundus micogutta TaxID=1921010 RepID=A0A1L8CLJ1_9PROT|nr:hypothetical protein MMIC_P0733 [Mariprofundus micogutta]